MLPKQHRLIKKVDFERIFRGRGIQKQSPSLRVQCMPNTNLQSRFGFIVSTAVSKKATTRNRIRRCLSECIRLLYPQFNKEVDCVIYAYPPAKNLSNTELRESLTYICKALGLIKHETC